jgi:hypothetical protein
VRCEMFYRLQPKPLSSYENLNIYPECGGLRRALNNFAGFNYNKDGGLCKETASTGQNSMQRGPLSFGQRSQEDNTLDWIVPSPSIVIWMLDFSGEKSRVW